MLDKLKSWFNKEEVSMVAILQHRSEGVFNIFKSTIDKLSDINKEVDQHLDVKLDQITNLQQEHSELTLTKFNNQQMINKIDQFLNGK